MIAASSLCSLEQTCRTAKTEWCTEEVWKVLATTMRVWKVKDGSKSDGQTDFLTSTMARLGVTSYKSLFCDPRLWLEMSAARVKSLPQWSEDKHPIGIECGKCGCNCGIPIEGKWRWERKEQLVS